MYWAMSTDVRATTMPVDDAVTDGRTKRTYERPILVRWGTLREVTMAVGAKGAADGASKGPRNTSL